MMFCHFDDIFRLDFANVNFVGNSYSDLSNSHGGANNALEKKRSKIKQKHGGLNISEKLSTFYLLQRISMAIQRGNAICVTTCVKDQSSGLEGLFNFHVHEAEEL